MLLRLLADLVMLVHLAFVCFAVAGALLLPRWPWLVWLHVPAAAWAAMVVFFGWLCPLTPLEQQLRIAAGAEGYEASFIEHYLLWLLYPPGLTRGVQVLLGALVIAINFGIYAWLVWHGRLRRARDATAGE